MNLIATLTECYLTEGYTEAQYDFSADAPTEEVATTIATFKQLVTQNRIYDQRSRSIDFWRKQGWKKFKEFVESIPPARK